MAIEVSSEIGYVSIVVVLSFISHLWMAFRVGAARKKYKVFYPTMYAIESENKEAKLFNCVQRGHQNFLENIPFFLALLGFAGVQHPRLAAGLGLAYLVTRIAYFIGYSSGNPQKRMGGLGSSMLCLIGLVGCNISFVVHTLGVSA